MGGESSNRHPASRLGLKSTFGEIVEVQGGHIVRSTGRKDRHSKVCTAKGPRDRRVRLAAHTAIQFYDVQDRLGYDRPSKAVDWLIKKAKAAIDELAQLPAWHPTATCSAPNAGFEQEDGQENIDEQQQQQSELGIHQADLVMSNNASEGQQTLHQSGIPSNPNPQISSFLPPSMDSDAIADTIKSFFPMGAAGEASSQAMQFHSQDLRLSLQSFQDPIMLHHHQHQHHSHQHHQNLGGHHAVEHSNSEEQQQRGQAHVLLSGIPLQFDGAAATWQEHHHHWNAGGDTGGGGGGTATSAGYLFNSPPAPQPLLQQLMLGHNNQFFSSQRGPLQSSNTPSVRAWMDPSSSAVAADQGHQPPHHHHQGFVPIYPSSVSGIGFASGFGGFSGFHIPARIQGDEEEHDGYSDKPSSASSDSRH